MVNRATLVLASALVLVASMGEAGNKKYPFAVGIEGDSSTYQISEDDIGAAIQWGTKNKGKMLGLQFRDTAARFLSASSDGAGSLGFSLEAYTPYAWVGQNCSWAAKRYEQMNREDITEEMLSPIFTVIVHPDTPRKLTASGMHGTSGVDHVIVRSTHKKKFKVLQPTNIEAGSESIWNALGAEVEMSSAVAYFAIDDVVEISRLDKKGEFFIVVIGDTGEEKKFKVKTKHFKRLP